MVISSSIFVAAILLGSTTQPSSLSPGNAFTMPDGITLFLPDGWRQVPEEAIEAQSQKIAYAFQKWPSTGWFAPPYIVVQIKRSGRIADPVQYARRLRDDMLIDMLKSAKAGQDADQPASRVEVEDLAYEPSGPAIWYRSQVSGWNEISVVKLTDFGSIRIVCYATQFQASQYVPVFEDILRSVAIADTVRYKPQVMTRRLFRLPDALVIGGILAGSITLLTVVIVRLRTLRTVRARGAAHRPGKALLLLILVSGLIRLLASVAIAGEIGTLRRPLGASKWYGPIKSEEERIWMFLFDMIMLMLLLMLSWSLNRRADRKYAAAVAKSAGDQAPPVGEDMLPNRAGLIQSGLWMFLLAAIHVLWACVGLRSTAAGALAIASIDFVIADLAIVAGLFLLLGPEFRALVRLAMWFAFGYSAYAVIYLFARHSIQDVQSALGLAMLTMLVFPLVMTLGSGLSARKALRRTALASSRQAAESPVN